MPLETSAPLPPPLTIAAGGISEYKVVRGDMADQIEIDAAMRLSKAIRTATGAAVPPASDWVKTEAEIPLDAPEILVGTTNRIESIALARELAVDDYVIAVMGRRVVIRGGSVGATDRAVDVFIEQCLTGDTLTLDGDLYISKVGQYTAVLQLDGEGIGESKIVIPDAADRYFVYAAELLRDAIVDVCGMPLSIVQEGTDAALCLGSLRFADEDSLTVVRRVRAFIALYLTDVKEGAVYDLAEAVIPTITDEATPVHPTLEGKLPVALVDQKTASVAVVDLAMEDPTTEAALIWEWKALPELGFNTTGYANSIDEARLRYDAANARYVVCVTSSAGFMGVAEYPSGNCIWNGVAKLGPHSMDWLPNGNIVVACSGNDKYDAGVIRVYAASQGKQASAYAEVKLYGAHSVLWDDNLGLVWGLGDDELCAYRIGGTEAAPTIAEVERLRVKLSEGGGHDLSADPDTPGIFWVAGKNVIKLNARTGKYTVMFSGSGYKAFGAFPGGTLVQTQATNIFRKYDTDILVWFVPDGAGDYIRHDAVFPTRAFYKARVWAG